MLFHPLLRQLVAAKLRSENRIERLCKILQRVYFEDIQLDGWIPLKGVIPKHGKKEITFYMWAINMTISPSVIRSYGRIGIIKVRSTSTNLSLLFSKLKIGTSKKHITHPVKRNGAIIVNTQKMNTFLI